MSEKNMSSIENLPDGKIALNVYTNDGIIKHIFDTQDELSKFLNKATTPKERDDYAGY
jgi:hypothetical protein